MKVKLIDGNKRACSKCNAILPLTLEHFCKSVTGTFGYTSCCKKCMEAVRRLQGICKQQHAEYKTENDILYKKCTKCGEYKTVSNFHKDLRHLDGLQSHCNECIRVAGVDHRRRNGIKPLHRVKLHLVDGIPHRECISCKKILPFENFNDVTKESVLGKASTCKDCHRIDERRLHKCARVFCKKQSPKYVVSVTCPICGLIFGLRQHTYNSRIKTNKNGILYCSLKCVGIANSKRYRETSKYAKKIKELQKLYNKN